MTSIEEDLRAATLLHNDAGIHYVYAIGNPCHHTQVMGDIQQRHVSSFLKLRKKVYDLSLYGHVKGRGRLVSNDQIRIARKGHGNHDPLQLPPAELVRIVLQALFRGDFWP